MHDQANFLCSCVQWNVPGYKCPWRGEAAWALAIYDCKGLAWVLTWEWALSFRAAKTSTWALTRSGLLPRTLWYYQEYSWYYRLLFNLVQAYGIEAHNYIIDVKRNMPLIQHYLNIIISMVCTSKTFQTVVLHQLQNVQH